MVTDAPKGLWNQLMEPDDLQSVGCERWREALSAAADGEDVGLDQRLVDAHVARCPGCQAFRAQLEQFGPGAGFRIRAAEPMRDLRHDIVKQVTDADRAASWGAARVALAVVVIEIVVLALPELVLGGDTGTDAHDARHLGAFSIAYAVALLMVVWRPARARTILPVATVLSGALFITAVIDIAEGRVPLGGEALHLPELLSVPLVWLLAVPIGERRERFRPPWRRRAPETPRLELIEDEARPSV